MNRQQLAAVHYIDGPLLVIAGAGSGKTRVITQKIAYLIQTCGLAAPSVCALTFTNKAANEMRARVAQLIPKAERRGLKVGTFHTLGLNIIKRHAALCGLRAGFSIFDGEDCLQLIKSLLSVAKRDDKEYVLQIQQQISRWKNELFAPRDALKGPFELPIHEEAALIYQSYQNSLVLYNAVDFDDLIRLPVCLWDEHPNVLEYWQNKIRYLLVDEYQDSNASQYQLVQKLVGSRAQFTVVGDDDQSIYAWRGARPEHLHQLNHDYPQLKVIKLEQNYRSTGRILHAANHLIKNNPHVFEKKLWSELGQGEMLRVLRCKEEQDEAEQVVADLISHKLRHRMNFGDYAILYRGNHQARVFEQVLRNYSIPYHLSGGQSWFAKSEIKDVMAYLKLLVNESDDAAFLRVIHAPKRGVGEQSLDALARYVHQQGISLYEGADHLALAHYLSDKPRAALTMFKQYMEDIKHNMPQDSVLEHLKQMLVDSGYEAYIYEDSDTTAKAQKRMDNVWELLQWVDALLKKSPDNTLADVVNQLILIDILEQSHEGSRDTVQLMTLHASKGLEFSYVYLVGMEEGLLPHRVSIEEEFIEEERRLAYVGITRAQKELCFTLALKRRKEGSLQDCTPSRFLDELPQDSLEWFGKGIETNPDQSKKIAKDHLAGLKNLLTENE